MNFRLITPALLFMIASACGGAGGPSPKSVSATASAPSVQVDLVNTYQDPITGETKGDPAGTASIDFTLDQEVGTTASVTFEFSADSGATWQPATVDEDTSSLGSPATSNGLAPGASGASHFQVTWQMATDLGPGNFASENQAAGFDAIQLRVVVVGGEPSPPAEDPVEVNLMGFPFPSKESLGTARSGNVAAVINGSDLLVIGGNSVSEKLAEAERGTRISDIADFVFFNVGSLGVARAGMSQTFLVDGTLLLAGGEDNSGARTEVDLFDPRDESFTSLTPLNLARTGHAALLLPNGRVCVVGGRSDATGGAPTSNSFEIFDAATKTWALGSLTGSYDEPLCVLLSDGRLLVSGPAPGGDTIQAEYLSLSGDSQLTSSPAPALLASRRGATATVLLDGKVLVFGGHDFSGNASSPTAELIDIELGTTVAIQAANPNIPNYTSQGRWDHDVALIGNGKLLVSGGRAATTGGVLSRTDYFLPLESTFTPSSLLPEARSGHHVNRLESGYLVISGGLGSDGLPLGTTSTLIPPIGTDSLPSARVDSLSWSSSAGLVRINYTLFDTESNPARVRIEWTTTPSASESWRPVSAKPSSSSLILESYTNLETSPTGTAHIFGWDSVADDIFAQGSPVEFSVRITPIASADGEAVIFSQILP